MENSSSLVLLGHINDVPQQHLEGPGTDRLDTLLEGADTSRAVRSALDQLPAEGWRMVKEVSGGGFHEEVWGCPATSGWWVLTFNHVRGVRHALVIPEPVDPIPQPQRAEGLTLRWATPTTATVAPSELSTYAFALELSNASTQAWANEADYSDMVMIFPRGIEGYHLDSPADPLPNIAPGASHRLAGYYTSQMLPPGTYELQAHMPDLRLSAEGTLSLTVTD
jgi:hypothetical protein